MKKYWQSCDGSAGVAVDRLRFLAANDEDEVIRLYRNDNETGAPLACFNFARELGSEGTPSAI